MDMEKILLNEKKSQTQQESYSIFSFVCEIKKKITSSKTEIENEATMGMGKF
jgi:hypothetical protein